jgi:hypothetical protein
MHLSFKNGSDSVGRAPGWMSAELLQGPRLACAIAGAEPKNMQAAMRGMVSGLADLLNMKEMAA